MALQAFLEIQDSDGKKIWFSVIESPELLVLLLSVYAEDEAGFMAMYRVLAIQSHEGKIAREIVLSNQITDALLFSACYSLDSIKKIVDLPNSRYANKASILTQMKEQFLGMFTGVQPEAVPADERFYQKIYTVLIRNLQFHSNNTIEPIIKVVKKAIDHYAEDSMNIPELLATMTKEIKEIKEQARAPLSLHFIESGNRRNADAAALEDEKEDDNDLLKMKKTK